MKASLSIILKQIGDNGIYSIDTPILDSVYIIMSFIIKDKLLTKNT